MHHGTTMLCARCGEWVPWVPRKLRWREEQKYLDDQHLSPEVRAALQERWYRTRKTPPCLECIEKEMRLESQGDPV